MFRKLSYQRRVRLINYYPPYIGAGVRMTELSDDFTYCRVVMRLRWWNRNIVGTHFGGSLYSMVDPFFMLLLMGGLPAKDYVIWDKAATIRFRRPGRSNVYAEFPIPADRMKAMRNEVAAAGGKKDFTFHTVVRSTETDEVIAEVEKVIYVRAKEKNR